MTQTCRLLAFFQSHGNQVTLGQCIEAGFYKLTARVSDLRKELRPRGGDIMCEQNYEHRTQNLYTLIPPPADLADVEFRDEGQQIVFALREGWPA